MIAWGIIMAMTLGVQPASSSETIYDQICAAGPNPIPLNYQIEKESYARQSDIKNWPDFLKNRYLSDFGIEQIKQLVNRGIENSHLAAAQKNTLKEIVERTEFVVQSENGAFSRNVPEGIAPPDNLCGSEGLSQNTVAGYARGIPVVIVCSGLLLNFERDNDPEISYRRLLFPLAHEIGHHLDDYLLSTESYPSGYFGFRNCSQNETMNKMGRFYQNSAQMREIAADLWAKRAVREVLGNEVLMDDPVKINFLRINYGFLCGNRQSLEHPGSEYRIKALLLSDSSCVL